MALKRDPFGRSLSKPLAQTVRTKPVRAEVSKPSAQAHLHQRPAQPAHLVASHLVRLLLHCTSTSNEPRNVTHIKTNEPVVRYPIVVGSIDDPSQPASWAAHRDQPAGRMRRGLRRWIVRHFCRCVRCRHTRTCTCARNCTGARATRTSPCSV